MNISTAAFNPIIHYKLDPGEWGSSSPSSAGTSISHVASHESSNIQRFESRAAKNGCYVISKDLYINLQYDGIYLAATGGKSSVITYCPKKEKQQEVRGNLSSMIDRKINQYNREQLNIDSMLKVSKTEADKFIYKNKLRQIEDRKLKLQQERLRLYTEITLLLAQNLNINPQMLSSIDLLA